MFICKSLGNNAPAKRVWLRERQVRWVFRGGTLIKQLEQVKCIHDALLSLRMRAAVQKEKLKARGDFTV